MKIRKIAVGFLFVMVAAVFNGAGSGSRNAWCENVMQDGTYQIEVTLEGGSGKAHLESPTLVTISGDEILAEVVFGSPYYDYMLLDGVRYESVQDEDTSAFEIPVEAFDEEISVTADTTAMSEPHEIDYTLYFDSSTLTIADPDEESGLSDEKAEITENSSGQSDAGSMEEADSAEKAETAVEAETQNVDTETASEAETQNGDTESQDTESADRTVTELPGLTYDHSLELTYAQCFSVDYYQDGYALVKIQDEDPFLIVPEGMDVPEGLPDEITPLQLPLDHIYLVATSSMDFFDALDALDHIRLSGTKESGWYIESAKEKMESGEIVYAGKYSAPDYELILGNACDLAIESTMIYHNPEVREELETLGIPVLVEHSSYEADPLGRMEWIKLYGVLTGKEEEAESIFNEQTDKLLELPEETDTGKTVAFFSINSNGMANVRKSGDYVVKMIEMAGGEYIFPDLGDGDNALSTVNMQMEEFYAEAKDADYLIYNSTIEGKPSTIADLLAKSEMLADFKAVQEGHVYATTENLFQKVTGLTDFILDINKILSDEDPENLIYLEKIS